MNIKTLSAMAIVTAALTGPASAQYDDRVYGPATGQPTVMGQFTAREPFAVPTSIMWFQWCRSTAMAGSLRVFTTVRE
jgi:hypothetical protein